MQESNAKQGEDESRQNGREGDSARGEFYGSRKELTAQGSGDLIPGPEQNALSSTLSIGRGGPQLRQGSGRGWVLALGVLLVLGAFYTLYLNQIRKREVFFNGDGGLKLTMARQMMAGGSWAQLKTPGPPWAQAWYDSAPGRYPLHDPFIYDVDGRKYSCFPIWFSLMTGPLDYLGGYRATFIVPILGAWGCWLVLAFGARRLGAPWWSATLATGWLALFSYLSIYTAIYCEHTLATLLAFSGVTLWLATIAAAKGAGAGEGEDAGREWVMGLGAGVLIGLSIYLRPELIGLAGAVAVVSAVCHRKGSGTRWMWVGLLVTGIGFLGSNYVLTGALQGVHSRTTLDTAWSDRLGGSFRACIVLPVYAPEFALGLALGAVFGLRQGVKSTAGTLFCVLALGWAVTPLLTPHQGGLQWGPRYYLTFSPLALLLTSLVLPRVWEAVCDRRLRAGAIVCLAAIAVYGARTNMNSGVRYMRKIYNIRIAPIEEYLKRVSPAVPVVADFQHVLLEVLPTVHERPMFRVESLENSQELQSFLTNHGQDHFIFISETGRRVLYPEQFDLPESATGPGLRVHMEMSVAVDGWYKLYVGKIEGR